MSEIKENNVGYVYILEVKDIDLPVCKIGMTIRKPSERCDEINKSSTGDFIWEVAYQIAVDNCRKLESLVHSKLSPLRQKRREFFNISAEKASVALNSILNSQKEIREIDNDEILLSQDDSSKMKKSKKSNRTFNRIDYEYADLLLLFASVINVIGRPFGQLNKPGFGVSDGNEGVQWNIAVSTEKNIVRLGVNLEGKKYNNWPISTFIQSEVRNPIIEKVVNKLKSPENIYIRFSRDAWQATARPTIVERYLGGKELNFSEINLHHWKLILTEALGCLNSNSNYRGRAKQEVTLESKPKNGEQIRVMEVSPHLTIWTSISLDGNKRENIERKISELQPVYDWVKMVSQG